MEEVSIALHLELGLGLRRRILRVSIICLNYVGASRSLSLLESPSEQFPTFISYLFS